MSLRSWGNYPKIRSKSYSFDKISKLRNIIYKNHELIPYGNGRSYGDSALNKNILRVKPYNLFLDFEESKGLLTIQAGLLLSTILEVFVPRGWFLKITPGTKFITVGGAIASDVHGKNHHVDGCFSECVEMFNLMLPNGEIITCSKNENREFFKATCGGMGLTGVILDAKISLKRIQSKFIEQKVIKTRNLAETFEVFENNKNKHYSAAWIDCLAKRDEIGKGLFMMGDFINDGRLDYQTKNKFTIPLYFPHFLLNKSSVNFFNLLYYEKFRNNISRQLVEIDSFFYPLDEINNWNRIYGRNGFTQYQFVLPKNTNYDGLEAILRKISNSGKGSFLSVLKLCGKANNNYLSFPMEGYSLALDFKIEHGIFELLDKLDEIVLNYGGRIYLSKDVRVSKNVFELGYKKINHFRAFREKYKMNAKFNSLQSLRIGI